MSGKTRSEKTFWERFNESFENQKRLISSIEYFEWLYEFTKKYPRFTDTSWLYKKDPTMSVHDYTQVDLLTDFFTAIDGYHTRNLLKANTEDHAAWYNIKYKDAYFAIGIRVGQGAENFVTRYERYEAMLPKSFIEFEDVMKGKQHPGFAEKNEALQRLQAEANLLRNLGVPREIVENAIKQAFK